MYIWPKKMKIGQLRFYLLLHLHLLFNYYYSHFTTIAWCFLRFFLLAKEVIKSFIIRLGQQTWDEFGERLVSGAG